MADVEEEMYLENLDEFVNDEDKIVTYKWLSRTLSVSTNRAKQMLYKFINHQKKSRPDIELNVTYLVGGQNQLNGEIVQRYVITGNQDLQETKKQFSTLTCVHVYSVQKCKLKDSNPLYTVDYNIQQEDKHNTNRWNHIHCKAAERLRDGRSRGTADDSDRTQPQTHKLTNGFHDASTSGGGTTRTEQNHQQTSGIKQKKGSKSGMDKFMSKVPATSKSTESSENKADGHKAEQSVPPSKKSGGSKAGIMKSFFAQRGTATNKKPDGKDVKTDDTIKTVTKQNATDDADTKPKQEDTKSEQEHKQMKNEPMKRTVSSSEDEEDPLPKKTSDSVATGKGRKANKSKNKQETENKSSAKGTTSQKARRKFKAMINDSDDDDEEDAVKPKKKRKRMKEIPREESSDEEPTTEDSPPSEKSPEIEQDSDSSTSIPNQQPQPTQNAGSRRRKRTKVMRSKTYMNDEGFMVTEKVWESDSTDASDVDMEEKQSSEAEHRPQANQAKPDTKRAKNHKSTAATNKPTKQASLMSFFNKT